MKKVTLSIVAMLGLIQSVFAQDENVISGLNDPAYGVLIKANFPGTGSWSRGFTLANQNNTNRLISFGAYGPHIGGVSSLTYGYIGKNYDEVYMSFLPNGNVGVGTTVPKDKFSVNGNIRAKEIKVEAGNWPDYVFEKDYDLKTLAEIEQFIKQNKHLPDMPSAKEVGASGQNLGEINAQLLKKIEELTLHLIEKDKQLAEEKRTNLNQENRLNQLENKINQLMKK